ncbi:MAG: porin [Colwellia sp.]|nr:porin [Colwellia sp.]
MKKQTITWMLMVSAAMLSQAVMANKVDIYGVGHLSLDSIDDGNDSSIHTTSSSSRFGLKGGYDLSPTLTVFFQYESGIDLTGQGENDGNGGSNSSGQFFTKTRPSFIGLSGDFGKVLIGHMPALDQWANDYNLFADQIGDLGNLWEGSGVPGRMDNTIHYATPDINGFDAALTLKPEENQQGSDNLIFKANYSVEGLKLGVAFASIGQGKMLDEHTVSAVTLGYYFSRFSIGGGFQTETDIGGIPGNDRDSVTFGASMKVSDNGTIKVQFAVSDGELNESEASQIAFGYDYAFDSKTTLYIAYAQMDNDDTMNFSVNGKGHGDKIVPMMGQDPSAISLGLIHKFDFNLLK